MVSYAELDFLDLENDHGHHMLLEKDTDDVESAGLSNVVTEHPFFKEAQKMKKEYVKTMSKHTQALGELRVHETNRRYFRTEVTEYFQNLEISDEDLSEKLKVFLKEFSEFLDERVSESKLEVDKTESNVAVCRRLSRVYKDMSCDNTYTCFMCLSRNVDTIFKPCHHTVCRQCSNHSRCPFCRGNVQSLGRIYFG